MSEVGIPHITTEEFQDLSKPMALDLTALFSLMRDEALYIIEKAGREGWTIAELEEELLDLVE